MWIVADQDEAALIEKGGVWRATFAANSLRPMCSFWALK
jgi:hypothetical protein